MKTMKAARRGVVVMTRFGVPIVAVLLAVATIAASAQLRAADDAAGFISDLGQRTVQLLAAKAPENEREAKFRAIFEEGFDIPTISRFVLGGYWRTASEAQRQDFTALFETYVIRAYAVRFNDYGGEQLKVTAARTEDEDNSMVQSVIARPSGAPPIKVDWRVNRTAKGFKITDVVVEGVSMAVTQRQEFASVIQRNGGQIDALLKLLREKTGQGGLKNTAG
jgi:phospholipid transport system substrate-binding protein